MTAASEQRQQRDDPSSAPAGECPLDVRAQTTNLCLFASCTGLIYLSAPVLYVGVTQASLCSRLGASDAVSNLPATAYFALTGAPVIIAWYSPFVASLKRNLILCFMTHALVLAAVALVLLSTVPPSGKVAMVVLQGAVSGITGTTSIALLWEAIGRGVMEKRRGMALSLAFGLGPVLAVLGSLATQFCLTGSLGSWKAEGLAFPANFALLYGLAAPAMLVAAVLASRLVIPLPERELARESFSRGVLGGVGEFLTDRLLLTATLVTVLVYTGNTHRVEHEPVHAGRPREPAAGLRRAPERDPLRIQGGRRPAPRLALDQDQSQGRNPRHLVPVRGGDGLGDRRHRDMVPAGLRNLRGGRARRRLRAELHPVGLAPLPDPPEHGPGHADDGARGSGRLTLRRDRRPGGTHSSPATGFRTSFAVCALIMSVGILIAVLFLPARPRPARDLELTTGMDPAP